jgi:hypothetical protein
MSAPRKPRRLTVEPAPSNRPLSEAGAHYIADQHPHGNVCRDGNGRWVVRVQAGARTIA